MSIEVSVELLAWHPELVPVLEQWFLREWPSYYGAGGPGDAGRDLREFANADGLPVGIVALGDGRVCGVAALKAESVASHRHLSPWAVAGLVDPALRGQGIGARLLRALELEARRLGFRHIHCATSSAESLLERCGWQLMERIASEDQSLGIYRKALE